MENGVHILLFGGVKESAGNVENPTYDEPVQN